MHRLVRANSPESVLHEGMPAPPTFRRPADGARKSAARPQAAEKDVAGGAGKPRIEERQDPDRRASLRLQN